VYKTAVVALVLSAVVAQAGTKLNSMSVSHNGDAFEGNAGSDWTDKDLQSNSFAVLCPQGQKVVDLQITRDAKGVAKFSGRCKK
jgi:hypothetical protein